LLIVNRESASVVVYLVGVKSQVAYSSGLSPWPNPVLIYINDLDDGIVNWILKFADVTKVFAKIRSGDDTFRLQNDLDRLNQWAREWQVQFNVKKCKVCIWEKNPCHQYRMNGHVLESVKIENDLGVVIKDDLKVSSLCGMAYLKANRTLGLMKHTIEFKSEFIILRLYKSLVRPHLEYSTAA